MPLELTEEQQLLRESVERFVERDYTFDKRTAMLAEDAPFSRELWRHFAELGWLGAGLPESAGGYGGGPVEQAVICEALGRAMVLEPFVSTAVVGAHALQMADNRELADALMPQLTEGELVVALAYAEQGARFDLHHVATRARRSGNTYSLTGDKIAVLDAPGADKLIVSARVDDEVRGKDGVALFLVDRDASGLHVGAFRTMDGSSAANVTLSQTPAELLVGEGRGLAALEQCVERGIAARCAMAAGAMDTAYMQTLAYLKTREQFGVPIGSFQVLQHRMVDMLIAVRECQSMMLMVADDVIDPDDAERRAGVAAAKTFVSKRARNVAQDIVQLHGGVGMTEELSIGHFFRYLTQFGSTYGTAAHHLERYTEITRQH
ncbi:MAG: acyl-CoA dehydrogenase [Pseudomonadota bacterium]